MARALLDQGHVLRHAFWPEPISLLQEGLTDWQRLLGPRQITDAYLLALAVCHGARRLLRWQGDSAGQQEHALGSGPPATPDRGWPGGRLPRGASSRSAAASLVRRWLRVRPGRGRDRSNADYIREMAGEREG